MSKINDGGPAFPCTNEQYTFGNPQVGDASAGMSLRDWFAGQALTGLLATSYRTDEVAWEKVAGRAYGLADAMLAERERQP